MNKLPQITVAFWIMKVCATTLGETGGDLLSMTWHVGYSASSALLLCFFFIALSLQLHSKKYNPLIYWFVILSTSTAGTTFSDLMDRTLGLGYAVGSLILVSLLVAVLAAWYQTERSLSVYAIRSLRGEIFYWITILISNTLGTALGDFLADSSGLGFTGGALLISGLLTLLVLAYLFTRASHVLLFWLAFVLTRPFGATFGDLLTKPLAKGGLNLGTGGSSLVLCSILMAFIVYTFIKMNNDENGKNISDTTL